MRGIARWNPPSLSTADVVIFPPNRPGKPETLNPGTWPQEMRTAVDREIGGDKLLYTLEHAIQVLDITRSGHKLTQEEFSATLRELREARAERMKEINKNV